MTDHSSQSTGTWGDALLDAGIEPMNPWEFLGRIHPKTRITPEIADALAQQIGCTPQFFLNMQAGYDRKLDAEAKGWRATFGATNDAT